MLFPSPNAANFVDIVMTKQDAVGNVAGCLSSGAGAGGADSHAVQHWLLRFGFASRKLRSVAAKEMGDWLVNGTPPWASFQAIVARQVTLRHGQEGPI
jgi:hypothetical protein